MVGQEISTTLEGQKTGRNMTTANQVSSTSSLDSSATGASSNLSYTIRHSPLNEQAQTLMGQPSTLPSTLPQIISSSEEHSNNINETTVNNMNTDSVSVSTNSTINGLTKGLHFNYSLMNNCTTGVNNKFPNVISPPVMSSASVTEIETSIAANNSVPEFLYQLTKMLTDDHRDIIEWSNGKIEVHNPHKLESDILNKYFRHSKYASFQRQLNYFGFRKLAGKGKMAPCSYVNENATHDLRSLLRMKRKTSSTTKENKGEGDSTSDGKSSKGNSSSSSRVVNPVLNGQAPTSSGTKRVRDSANGIGFGPSAKIAVGKGVKHQLNGFLKSPSTSSTQCQTSSSKTVNNPLLNEVANQQTEGESSTSYNPHTIALSAVGKGVCHQFPYPAQLPTFPSDSASKSNNPSVKVKKESTTSTFTFLDPAQLGMGIESSLSELKNNFRNSLNDAEKSDQTENILKRESSLVNLAMIPEACPTVNDEPSKSVSHKSPSPSNNLFTFIDFPCELDPSSDKS